MSVKIWLYDLYNMYSSLYICSILILLLLQYASCCHIYVIIFMLFACIAFCMLSDLGGNKISYLLSYLTRRE